MDEQVCSGSEAFRISLTGARDEARAYAPCVSAPFSEDFLLRRAGETGLGTALACGQLGVLSLLHS